MAQPVQYPNRYMLYTRGPQKNPCVGSTINKDLFVQNLEDLFRAKVTVPSWLSQMEGPVLVDTFTDRAYQGPSLQAFVEAHATKTKRSVVYDV